MKSVAIMQPYFFPYLGYFQLVHSSDLFICFDDVNFIKKGWIHRNQLIVNGKAHLFSIPLIGASQNKKINQLELEGFSKWREGFLKMVRMNYGKCSEYNLVYPWLENLLNQDHNQISELNYSSIIGVLEFLDCNSSKVIRTSSLYHNADLVAQERIIDICKQEKADVYINAIGGQDLYQKEAFNQCGMELRFLKSREIIYPQKSDIFVPYMSILDVLFNVPVQAVKNLFDNYDLLKP